MCSYDYSCSSKLNKDNVLKSAKKKFDCIPKSARIKLGLRNLFTKHESEALFKHPAPIYTVSCSEDMLLGDETATTTFIHINIPGILMWLGLHSAKNLTMPICKSTFTTA